MFKLFGITYWPVTRGGPVVLRKVAIGDTKTQNGVTYRLNQNHRWTKIGHESPGQMSLLEEPAIAQGQTNPMSGQALTGQPTTSPTPAQESSQELLTGITPKRVLNLNSGDAKQFERFLTGSSDPEVLLEMIIPENWSTSNLKKELAQAKDAIATFERLGILQPSEAYESFEVDDLPDSFWDFDSVEDAIAKSELVESALNPTARAIGKLLQREENESAFDHYYSKAEAGADLEKAGKPCGWGWIAENKNCSPEKRRHAIKSRRSDMLRYANRKRQEKGLSPQLKPPPPELEEDISLDDLDASEQMLRESEAKFGISSPVDDEISDDAITFEDALNNIVLYDKEQARILRALKVDLLNLQGLAKEFAEEAASRGSGVDWDEIGRQVQNRKAIMNRVDKLNRLYSGRVTLDDARHAALQTRLYHLLHPRKKIQVPKGTTQQEYINIVQALMDGDKSAIKRYTVKRPAKSKKRKKK